jgi:hypothetical protein
MQDATHGAVCAQHEWAGFVQYISGAASTTKVLLPATADFRVLLAIASYPDRINRQIGGFLKNLSDSGIDKRPISFDERHVLICPGVYRGVCIQLGPWYDATPETAFCHSSMYSNAPFYILTPCAPTSYLIDRGQTKVHGSCLGNFLEDGRFTSRHRPPVSST